MLIFHYRGILLARLLTLPRSQVATGRFPAMLATIT
jgi:hypothetical protein